MCFGPSDAEKEMAAKQREAADDAKREAIEDRAESKRDDIDEALSTRTINQGKRGGVGRRSLFSSGSAGFLGRFG